jgi:hypothetical protein
MLARPLIIAFPIAAAFVPTAHADKLTEANMTKKDFDDLTRTESSEVGKPAMSVRRWDYAEREKLPKAVKRDPATSHSDRSGTTIERTVLRPEKP